jgi:hypothetical protein
MSIPDQLLTFDSFYFLLFIIPGFITVWTFRSLSKTQSKSDFEYFALSAFWGLVMFIIFLYTSKAKILTSIFNDFYPFTLVFSSVSFQFLARFRAR